MVKMSLIEFVKAIDSSMVRDDLKEQIKFIASSIFNNFEEVSPSTCKQQLKDAIALVRKEGDAVGWPWPRATFGDYLDHLEQTAPI